jgi:PAS domain-containing protein
MARTVDRGDAGSPDPAVTSQLLAFVEKTSDLVGVVDERSRVLYLNEAARKRLGVGDTTDLTTVDMFPPRGTTPISGPRSCAAVHGTASFR